MEKPPELQEIDEYMLELASLQRWLNKAWSEAVAVRRSIVLTTEQEQTP